jgi:hypothetical protein
MLLDFVLKEIVVYFNEDLIKVVVRVIFFMGLMAFFDICQEDMTNSFLKLMGVDLQQSYPITFMDV